MPTIWDIVSGRDRKRKTDEQEERETSGNKKQEEPKREEMSQADFSGYGSGSKRTRPGYSKKWKQ